MLTISHGAEAGKSTVSPEPEVGLCAVPVGQGAHKSSFSEYPHNSISSVAPSP